MKIISFMFLMSFLMIHIVISIINIRNSIKNIKKMKDEINNRNI